MRKFLGTLQIVATLMMARTFGRYLHSGWDGEIEYALYEYRGRRWVIPTGPVECD